jgi:hypothetical protein
MTENLAAAAIEHVDQGSTDEQRGRVRHRCKLPEAFYRSNQGGSPIGWLAEVRDISATGIGLALRRRFEQGAVLFIELTSTLDNSAHLLPVTVVHATQSSDGDWILGCTFSRTLTDAELAELVLDQPRGRVFA